jgi:Ca2+-transporting ATPase
MTFITIISCQLFYSLAVRNRSKSVFQIGVFSNKSLIAAIVIGFLLQLLVIGIPSIRKAFNLQMLDLVAWLIVVFLGTVPLIANELYKIFLRSKEKKIVG